MAADNGHGTVDGKHIGDTKRRNCPIGRFTEVEWSRVESMSFEQGGAIGQLKQAIWCDCGYAVES